MKVCERCGQERQAPGEISANPRGRVCYICQAKRRNELQRGYYRKNKAKMVRRARENYAKAMADPEQHERIRQLDAARKREARKDPAKNARMRAASRRWKQRMLADPERHAAYLDGRRIGHRIRMERRGRPVPPVKEDVYVKRYGNGYGKGPRVDAEPVRRLLKLWLDSPEDVIAEFGRDAGQAVLGMHTRHRLEREAGVSDRSLGRLLNGQKSIALRNADKICTALDVPLAMLYPELT